MNPVPDRYSEESYEDKVGGSLQMHNFARGLKAYASGKEPPEGCYPGEYTQNLALQLAKTVPLEWPLYEWAWFAGNRTVQKQKEDLKVFGCEFDTWSYESELHTPVLADVRRLCSKGQMFRIGLNGQRICGNCAWPLKKARGKEECHPCPFCNGEVSPTLGVCNPLSHDPALHPDNDFMPD